MILKGKKRVLLYAPQPALMGLMVYDRVHNHEFGGVGLAIVILASLATFSALARALEAWKYQR